jgi:far upstream element-binding protein
MDDAVAAARAKALLIASQLSTKLGKHPRDEGNNDSKTPWPVGDGRDSSGGHASSGAPGRKRKKIYVPQEPADFNYLGLLIGPRGATQKRICSESGARIVIRGRGSSKDGNDEDPDEDMYVMIQGDTDAQIDRASEMINDLFFNREAQAAVKEQQLREVAVNKGNLVLSKGLYADDIDYLPMRGSGEKSKALRIPADTVGLVIGRGGENM